MIDKRERPSDLELQAFLDGELPAERQRAMAAAIAADPALAHQAAELRALQARFDDLAGVLGALPLPSRLQEAAAQPPSDMGAGSRPPTRPQTRAGRRIAGVGLLLATIVVAVVLTVVHPGSHDGGIWRDPEITAALAARAGTTAPIERVSFEAGEAADGHPADAADRIVAASLGASTRTPDLGRMGFRLVSAELFASHAAQLRYRDAAGHVFAVYVHRGRGTDRFALVSRGEMRVCLWQNEEASAVMTGTLSNSELFRLSSAVYVSMQL